MAPPIISKYLNLDIPLPATRKRQTVVVRKLPISPPGDDARLTVVTGLSFVWPHGLTLSKAAGLLRGWRLHVDVDGASLVDGEPLERLYRLYYTRLNPVRSAGEQVVVLTPRAPARVEVAVGLEWRGKGAPRAFPKGLRVLVRGVD